MEILKTSDLGTIAALVAKGYSPHERIKEEGKVFFVFESDEIVKQIVQDYFNNRLDVDALIYYSALKNTKRSIYELD